MINVQTKNGQLSLKQKKPAPANRHDHETSRRFQCKSKRDPTLPAPTLGPLYSD